jgi:hypothetical protein
VRQQIWNFLFAGKAGFWTAIFTGMLTLFTYMMVQVSKTTNETARSSERAFLSFGGVTIGPKMMTEDMLTWRGYEITLNWNNSGTTPAKNLVFQANIKPWPISEELPQSYEFPLASEKSRGTVGPKANYGANVFIPRGILEDAYHGKERVYLWGTIVYKDIFENDPDRLTEFCVEITRLTTAWSQPPKPDKNNTTPSQGPIPIDNPNAMLVGFQTPACRDHNCYDNDCKDYQDKIKDMR